MKGTQKCWFGIKTSRIRAVGLLLGLLLAGMIFAWWVAARAQREMLADLLQQTRLVARTLDRESIQALTGSEADLGNPEYLRLKKHLATVRVANPQCRFAYLMGRKSNGALFFFVDSEPPTSKDYSPPGQIYEEATEITRRVFSSRIEATEGPVSDRWGAWVSGLVPIFDPASGGVIAVFGMDIDASTWEWDILAQSSLPIGLMFVLLIGTASIYVSSRRVDASAKLVLRRLLPSLALMVILLIVGAYFLLWHQQSQWLAEKVAAQIETVGRELSGDLATLTSGMVAVVRPIAVDPLVQEALRENNADALLERWRPVFDTLKKENAIGYFSFFDRQRHCILRLHELDRRGDLTHRFTLVEAEHTGKLASGIELGPLGTSSLRVVEPVFDHGVLVGYVELGKEIESLLQSLHSRSGFQLAVATRKSQLNEQSWEEGMWRFGKKTDWDRLPNSTTIFSSQGALPEVFTSWADQMEQAHPSSAPKGEITFNGREWRVSAIALLDAAGKAVGDLLIMRDVSAEHAAFTRMLTLGGTGGGVLLAMLLGFVYVQLRRTDAGIRIQQTALKEAHWRLENIIEATQVGTWEWNVQTGETLFNHSLVHTLGYTLEELTPATIQTWKDLTCPEDWEASSVLLERHFAGELSFHECEVRIKHKEGRWVWVQTRGRLMTRSADGSPLFMFGTVADITERKRAESALRLQSSALEAAANAIVITNNRGAIEWANPAFSSYTGYGLEEVIGKTMSLLKSGIHDNEFYRNLWETILARNVWHGEMTNRRKDGSLYTVEATITPVRNAVGEVTHFISVNQDITQRKQMEEKFLRTQRMESLGTLASGVAHDLNNILTPIMLSAGMLRHSEDNNEREPLIACIEESAKRGASVVKQVLTFARGTTGEKKTLMLDLLIKEITKITQSTFPRNIAIVSSIQEKLWSVRADPTQIHQVLLNLCINSRDAMPEGGRLLIAAENSTVSEQVAMGIPDAKPGDYVLVSVVDTGTGIAPEVLGKIFEPFFTLKEIGKGTGLGLSVALGIVRSHDGFITVESELGMGCTFRIYLPRECEEAESLSILAERQPAMGNKEVILVVDDEPGVLSVTALVLRQNGYQVITAVEGNEALARYRECGKNIKLVFTDVMMPGMDGVKLSEKLKQLDPSVKIIAVTGQATETHQSALRKLGVSVILRKPYQICRLLEAVQNVLL